LPIHSNIFSCKKEIDQNLTVDIYRVEGIPKDDNRFRNLSKVKENLSHRLRVLVVLYSPGEQDYAMALEPTSATEFSEAGYSVKIEKRTEPLVNYPQQLR